MIEHLPSAYRINPAPQYRVRLLREPVMLYNGRSYMHAKHVLDMCTHDRAMEERIACEYSGWRWRTVMSVENGA